MCACVCVCGGVPRGLFAAGLAKVIASCLILLVTRVVTVLQRVRASPGQCEEGKASTAVTTNDIYVLAMVIAQATIHMCRLSLSVRAPVCSS